MNSIQFYHLTTTPLDRALPKLLEKCYSGGFRTLVVASSEAQVDQLDQLLWTYDPSSFLPHSSKKGGNFTEQPILLSDNFDDANQPNLLLIINGATPPDASKYDRILDIFDGNDNQAVVNARKRWMDYKNGGNELSYLKQTESGGWEKKAV